MNSTCLNSSVSLRCRGSRSSYFDDSTYLLDSRFESNSLLFLSSIGNCCCCCCCCCANNNLSYNRLPRINPSFLCNGLRQSTLIQFSPRKRLIDNGRRRQPCNNTYRFSSLTDSDRNYYYEKLYSFKERRKLGKGRYVCSGYEDKRKEQFVSNEIDDDYVDEVEILLDLLENNGVRERKTIEKKYSCHVSGKTKNVHSGSVKKDIKCDNKAVKVRSREEEDRRLSNKIREEESRTFRKGMNEQKKEGSSCSSYYSISSTGEYENDNDVEIKHDDCLVTGESSSEYKDDRKTDNYRSYDEEIEENVDRRQEIGKEQSDILKKNTAETYYESQEWRKKSEKKLNVESSHHTEQNSRQNSEKTDKIIDQSQSRTKHKSLTETSETDKRLIETSSNTQKLTSVYKGESDDHVSRQNEYIRRSNVILEASGIHETDNRETSSSSSSSLETRMKNWEDNSTEVSGLVEDRREEKKHKIENSRVKTQQISEISNTHITNTENEYSSYRFKMAEGPTESLKTGRRTTKASGIHKIENSTEVSGLVEDRKEEKHHKIENSRVKTQQISEISDTRITNTENVDNEYSSYRVNMAEGPTEPMKTGRTTTKASSFHVGMPKETSSTYKALKLNPEPRLQETEARGSGQSGSLQLATNSSTGQFQVQPHESSRVQPSEILDSISSADQQQKSSSHFVGEFVKKAKHELVISEGQQEKSSGEDGSGNSDQKDGPSDDMWHEMDAPDSTGNGESVKMSGRSLWNVIGDMVRLRWTAPRSETHTPKSSGGKASSNQSTGSERWFSGHEQEDSEIGKMKSTKSRSSLNTNQGSSSKTMSPSIIEESSFPLPPIRMRRAPVLKKTSVTSTTDASGSGKMDQLVPKPLTQVPQTDASGSGKTVIIDRVIESRSKDGELKQRKFARIDQVSKDKFDEWEEAYSVENEQRKNDELFMREALLEAKKAADFWEVPVGAVLVHDGKVIARGYNLVEELRDVTAHAEMICIREASNNLRSWRLSGTTLYVTLEPCPMCAGAILQARIDTVVWGAPNKLLGADGSWIRLFPDVDGVNGSDKPPAPVHPFHPNMVVRRGVLSAECADVMQQFFQLRRKKKEKKTEGEDEPPTPSPPSSSCLPITHHRNSKFFSKMHDAFSIMFCL